MKTITLAALALFLLSLCGCGGGGSSPSAATTTTALAVSFSAGAHGSLTGNASQTLAAGGSTSAVTAHPAAGYHFVNWTGDNGFPSNGSNPLTLTNMTYSCNITANFAVNPSSAVLKLSSSGSLDPGVSLSGLGVKLQLPAGVTVSADGGNVVAPGVVTASGVGGGSSINLIVYTPATLLAPGTLEFLVVSNAPGGMGVGEFATVNCLIADGNFPVAADFLLPAADFKPADLLLQPVNGLTATLSAAIL